MAKNIETDTKSDLILLQAFLKGNKDAFSLIYEKYTGELLTYGLSLGFEKKTIEDAVHDTFVKLYTDRKHLKNVVSLKYYLFKMLKNRLLNIYQSKKKETCLNTFEELPFFMEVSVLDKQISREENQLLALRIENLLSVLTNRQKEAVYLRFAQEMEYEQIADLLKMTAPAVRKLISRAIKRMRNEDF